MPLYGGIDLHAHNSVVVLLNDQDQVIYQKRLPNQLPAILEPFVLYHGEIEGVVVESTYNWSWLVDGFREAGYRVHLATPAAMQQYNDLKYTNDHSDARWLAHLLRLGVLPEGYISLHCYTNPISQEERHTKTLRAINPCFLHTALAISFAPYAARGRAYLGSS